MKANKTLYVVIALFIFLATFNCCKDDHDEIHDVILTSDEFGNSKWRGKDSNGNNVELEVNMPHMTLTYFHYANGVSKSNKEIVKLVFSTTNYSYNPETGKFKDDNSTNISGVVKDKTTIEISLPKEVVTLTKQK